MAQSIVILDYGSGNLRSVGKALERAAADHDLDASISVRNDAASVMRADRLVLPGVGAFGHCAENLRALPGVWEALQRRVLEEGVPFLGICVGMQLMATRGLEHGVHGGLDWIAGDVVRLAPADPALKIPHMGWNRVHLAANHALLRKLPDDTHAYFVHSYQFHCAHGHHCLAQTEYGGRVTAIVGRDNLIGTQFHPEKSQGFGRAFLSAFLEWTP